MNTLFCLIQHSYCISNGDNSEQDIHYNNHNQKLIYSIPIVILLYLQSKTCKYEKYTEINLKLLYFF